MGVTWGADSNFSVVAFCWACDCRVFVWASEIKPLDIDVAVLTSFGAPARTEKLVWECQSELFQPSIHRYAHLALSCGSVCAATMQARKKQAGVPTHAWGLETAMLAGSCLFVRSGFQWKAGCALWKSIPKFFISETKWVSARE